MSLTTSQRWKGRGGPGVLGIVAVLAGSLSCGAGGGVLLPQDPVTVTPCGEAHCDSAIRYQTGLSAMGRDEILGWTITLCHQAICASSRFWGVLDTGDFACLFQGPITAVCSLRPVSLASTDYTLAVTFHGPGEDFQPGDRFTVRIVAASGGPAKLEHSTTVASYQQERPNGEACAPLCRSASLN